MTLEGKDPHQLPKWFESFRSSDSAATNHPQIKRLNFCYNILNLTAGVISALVFALAINILADTIVVQMESISSSEAQAAYDKLYQLVRMLRAECLLGCVVMLVAIFMVVFKNSFKALLWSFVIWNAILSYPFCQIISYAHQFFKTTTMLEFERKVVVIGEIYLFLIVVGGGFIIPHLMRQCYQKIKKEEQQ